MNRTRRALALFHVAFAFAICIAWPASARADAQFATDVSAGAGVRMDLQSSPRAFGTVGIWVDALLGSPEGHWNAPRLGPFLAARRDVGNAYASSWFFTGLSILLLGDRTETNAFDHRSFTLSFGFAAGQDAPALQPSAPRLGAVLRAYVGYRVTQPWASVDIGLFAEYIYVVDGSSLGQHDVVIGLQLEPLMLGGIGWLRARRAPAMQAR